MEITPVSYTHLDVYKRQAQLYEYDVQEYANCPAAADPDVWDFSIEMNWNASWYDDCVSLVAVSYTHLPGT